jgi:hypothetical protein
MRITSVLFRTALASVMAVGAALIVGSIAVALAKLIEPSLFFSSFPVVALMVFAFVSVFREVMAKTQNRSL